MLSAGPGQKRALTRGGAHPCPAGGIGDDGGRRSLMAIAQEDTMATQRDRTEHDSMGELQVPAEALWGAQTQRAVGNFPVSGRPMQIGRASGRERVCTYV